METNTTTVDTGVVTVVLGVLSALSVLSSAAILILLAIVRPRLTAICVLLVRSLCVADLLYGVYGLVRTIMNTVRPQWVNFFLAEGLLFTSQLSSNLTVVLWAVNLHSRTSHAPDRPHQSHDTVTWSLLAFLWNCSCVFGFVSLSIWDNDNSHYNHFFVFHSGIFLIVKACFILSCLLVSVSLLITVCAMPRNRREAQSSSPATDPPTETTTSSPTPTTSVVTYHQPLNITQKLLPCLLITMATCLIYIPVALYELIHCQYGPLYNKPYADTVLLYLHLLGFFRSMFNAAVISYFVSKLKLSPFCVDNRCCYCCRQCSESTASFDITMTSARQFSPARFRINSTVTASTNTLDSGINPSLVWFSGYQCSHCGSYNPVPQRTGSTAVLTEPGTSSTEKTDDVQSFPSHLLIPGCHHNWECPLYNNRSMCSLH